MALAMEKIQTVGWTRIWRGSPTLSCLKLLSEHLYKVHWILAPRAPFVGYCSEVLSWMFDLDYIHMLLRNLSCEQNVHKAGILAREICSMLESNAAEATRTAQVIARQSRDKANRTPIHVKVVY